MKLSKVLRAIGSGAAIAVQFMPAGPAITNGLDVVGKVLNHPEAADEDAPETCREIAVQAVLEHAGVILAAAITKGRNEQSMLEECTDALESWLRFEATSAAVAAGKAEGK